MKFSIPVQSLSGSSSTVMSDESLSDIGGVDDADGFVAVGMCALS